MPPFVAPFAALPDPRVDRSQLPALLDILVIALCTLLCGGEGWEDMTEFGRAKEPWLRARWGWSLPNGIPSPDTFRRLFERLDPDAFTHCFTAWVATLRQHTHGEGVNIAGKTLRHRFDHASGQAPIPVVSAWAGKNRRVLGQFTVADFSQRDYREPRVAGVAGPAGRHRHPRCHGLPEKDRPPDHRPRRRRHPGAERQPGGPGGRRGRVLQRRPPTGGKRRSRLSIWKRWRRITAGARNGATGWWRRSTGCGPTPTGRGGGASA